RCGDLARIGAVTSKVNEDPVRSQAVDWFMQTQASPHDAELRACRDRWLAESDAHRLAYKSVQRTWDLAAGLPMPESGGGLGRARPGHGIGARGRRPLRGIGIAVAGLAACLLLLFLPSLRLHLQADYLTGTAELRDVTLDDGSEVHLDAGSAIAIDQG